MLSTNPDFVPIYSWCLEHMSHHHYFNLSIPREPLGKPYPRQDWSQIMFPGNVTVESEVFWKRHGFQYETVHILTQMQCYHLQQLQPLLAILTKFITCGVLHHFAVLTVGISFINMFKVVFTTSIARCCYCAIVKCTLLNVLTLIIGSHSNHTHCQMR